MPELVRSASGQTTISKSPALSCFRSAGLRTREGRYGSGSARNEILQGRIAAPIGNVGDLDADCGIEQRAGKMDCGTLSSRTVLHLRLVCLRVPDEVLQVIGGI